MSAGYVGNSLPRHSFTPAHRGEVDPGIDCFPCVPYAPQPTFLPRGHEMHFHWPHQPQPQNGVITNVDPNNLSAPYTVDVSGKSHQMMIDSYSGLFQHDTHQGVFRNRVEHVDDNTSKQVAHQVLLELKQNEQLSDPYLQISRLVAKVVEICSQENALLELDFAPGEKCAIFGDIHGNFRCLKNLLGHRPRGEKTKFLFLGDFIDRGCQQLEVVAYLFAKKVLFPNSWLLVRGNHEDMSVNQRYGFEEECKRRIGPENGVSLFRKVNDAFQYLPMAAIITVAGQKGVFCCHGGIGPDMTSRDAIKRIQKPCSAPCACAQPWERILRDLTWSDVRDPRDLHAMGKAFDSQGWCKPSSRGPDMYIWGPQATDHFLQAMNCRLIIRAHDPNHAPSSLKPDHDQKVWTVFSSTPYPVSSNDGQSISNEGAVMMVLDGSSGEFSAIKINPYHQITSIDRHEGNIVCDGNTGRPAYDDGAGNLVFHLPEPTDLSRVASDTGAQPPLLTRQISVPKAHGLPKTSFVWQRGLHVLFGNIVRDGTTHLWTKPDGETLPEDLRDGDVVVIDDIAPDKHWAKVWSARHQSLGWTRTMYLHQQMLDLHAKDVQTVPGLQGKFVLTAGTEVIVGADHSHTPGMCPIFPDPQYSPHPIAMVVNGSKALIEHLGHPDTAWTKIRAQQGVGWLPSRDFHVQAHSNDHPAVPPFTPVHYKKVVFGCCIPGKPGVTDLMTHDGHRTGHTLHDGEVVQIVKEDGLTNANVEVVSTPPGQEPIYGWFSLAHLHIQVNEEHLRMGTVLPGAKAGICAFTPGRKLMVGITHKNARQSTVRIKPNSHDGVGMVTDGEEVVVESVTEDGLWVEVRTRTCRGWLPSQSVHAQLI